MKTLKLLFIFFAISLQSIAHAQTDITLITNVQQLTDSSLIWKAALQLQDWDIQGQLEGAEGNLTLILITGDSAASAFKLVSQANKGVSPAFELSETSDSVGKTILTWVASGNIACLHLFEKLGITATELETACIMAPRNLMNGDFPTELQHRQQQQTQQQCGQSQQQP
jgi:hypothetical protein